MVETEGNVKDNMYIKFRPKAFSDKHSNSETSNETWTKKTSKEKPRRPGNPFFPKQPQE